MIFLYIFLGVIMLWAISFIGTIIGLGLVMLMPLPDITTRQYITNVNMGRLDA